VPDSASGNAELRFWLRAGDRWWRLEISQFSAGGLLRAPMEVGRTWSTTTARDGPKGLA
jgi:hypothetical protein